MRRLAAIMLLPLLAATASGQGWGDLFPAPQTPGTQTGAEECPPQRTWQAIEPTATDVRAILFESRTLSAATGYRAEVISGTDADPNDIVSSVAVAGGLFSFVLAPTAAREGNWYQVCAQPTDSNGRTPIGCACIEIKRTRYARPR